MILNMSLDSAELGQVRRISPHANYIIYMTVQYMTIYLRFTSPHEKTLAGMKYEKYLDLIFMYSNDIFLSEHQPQ